MNCKPDNQTPPYSEAGERGVIGSILLDCQVIDDLASLLRPEDFYNAGRGIIYRHAVQLHAAGVIPNDVTLHRSLKASRELEASGGVAELMECLNVPHAANAVYYAEMVRDCSRRRAVIDMAHKALDQAHRDDCDVGKLLADQEDRLAVCQDVKSTEAKPIADLLNIVVDRHAARYDTGDVLSGLGTGLHDVDTMLGGLQGGQLIVVAARPGLGKTSLATGVAEYVAAKSPTLFVSLEMAAEEIVNRQVCSKASVSSHQMRSTRFNFASLKAIQEAAPMLATLRLNYDDSPGRTVAEIAATARKIQRKEGLGLLVVDYLQLVQADSPRDPRQEQVAKIARRLKALARSLNVPILALAQLNRGTEGGRDNRPKLAQLRESGAIEQDADVVLLLHREDYYATNDDDREKLKGQAEVIVAKNRNGPTGDVKVVWRAEYSRFGNLHEGNGEQYDFGAQDDGGF